MNVELFSVFDQAAARYMDPFPGPTIEFAIRGFREACTTEGHQFQKYPEDYALYHVATFDAELGVVSGFAARKISNAASFVFGAQLNIDDEEQKA